MRRDIRDRRLRMSPSRVKNAIWLMRATSLPMDCVPCINASGIETALMSDTLADPLAWRPLKAPSLEEIHVIAEEAYRRLPKKFKSLCEGLVIHVEDFPTEEVLNDLEAETEFDLLG